MTIWETRTNKNKIEQMEDILHMSMGDGESSYAANSLHQETGILMTLPVLKDAIKGITNHDLFFGRCFKMADLGCSSTKNTLLLASNIIDIVIEVCKENSHKSPQFEVCLNDLFGSDFNTLSKMLPDFYAELKEEQGDNFVPCFVSFVPGSFYGRLFPDQSLHLVHSSYSVHWLSQVPEGLESNSLNIYLAKTSPPNVFQAYAKQFNKDFTKFLQMRSEEIVHGGRMVLTLSGRNVDDPDNSDLRYVWELIAQSLREMAKEGLVRESDINKFNMPIYHPCEDELRSIIQLEGSFSLESSNIFQFNLAPQDIDFKNLNDFDEPFKTYSENVTKTTRVVTEPLLTSHFGKSIIDEVYRKLKKHMASYLTTNKPVWSIVISLARK